MPPAPTPRAVLFDFDGTLIDSFPAIAASVNHVRALRGLAPLSVAEVTRHVGRGAWHLLRHTVERGELEANVAAYREHHPSVLRDLTRLLPGAREALDALKARGVRLGVCSNKPVDFSRRLVEYLGVAAHFDVVLGPEDVARPKPAPDMLLEAMRRLGCRPEEVLYVGDMTVDVETARAAGVTVWVVATGTDAAGVLDAARPDRRLGGLAELAGLLG
jgi:2-phosphoglycolate phosphatase